MRRELGGAGQQRVRRVLEPAVDLVGEQVGAGLRGEVHQRLERRAVDVRSGRVVGEVDDDGPRLGAQRAAHGVDLERPAAVVLELHGGHRGARRARHLVQRLVGGGDHDRVVAAAQRRVGEGEDPLLGSDDDEHVLGLEARVERGDLLAQGR